MKKTVILLTVMIFVIMINAFAQETKSGKIEMLSFTHEDLPEITDPETFLPWMDSGKMIFVLKDVKHVKYRRESVTEKKVSTILSKIAVDTLNQSVEFTNLMITKNDTMQFSQNYKDEMSEAYNYFFPRNEMMYYRLVGVETLEVPAGKYECTVLEGFDDETKVKYWMINDKPGVYAKIIEEGEDHFGNLEQIVYELEEIK